MLLRPVAELDQVALGEADRRNAARLGGGHDRGGARPETVFVGNVAERLDRRSDVEPFVLDRGDHELAGVIECLARHLLLVGVDDQLVEPANARLPGAAEARGYTGEALQLERHVFHDMGRPGAFPQAAQEAARLTVTAAVLGERRQPRRHALVHAGHGVRGAVLEGADVHPRFDARHVGPQIRAAQMQGSYELDVSLAHDVRVSPGWRKGAAWGAGQETVAATRLSGSDDSSGLIPAVIAGLYCLAVNALGSRRVDCQQ